MPGLRYARVPAVVVPLGLICYLLAQPQDSPGEGELVNCNGQWMTAAEVAEHRGISPDLLPLLWQHRSLSPHDVCVMPEAKLQRALERVHHPKPSHPGDAIEFRLRQWRDESGSIPENAWGRAHVHIEAMRANASFRPAPAAAGVDRGSWSWIGPGNIGGRVRSLVVHPINPSVMLAGSVSGGIWRTTDGGASWSPVDDFMANLAVSTIVIDPLNPSRMYAGTGEGFFNSDAIRGAGVFVSDDGGLQWSQLPSTAGSNFFFVNRLSVSPDAATLLAATGSGIYRSVNGGFSFTAANVNFTVYDIDFHPWDSSRAVAAGNGSVWYSTDGGLSWTIAGGIPASSGRVEIAYAPSHPTIVYASVNRNGGTIYRSDDGGATFAYVSGDEPATPDYLGGQGWYDNVIWVEPTNPNFLVLGGIDLWRSTNGGGTLKPISTWWAAPASAHADHHVIVAHPHYDGVTNRTVVFGNDGGVYTTSDVHTVGSETFSPFVTGWVELNNNFGVTQFYGAGGNPQTGTIVGGTQDNGTLVYTSAGGTEGWTTMFGGDGGFSASDPFNPNIFYGEYVRLQIHRSTNGGLGASYIIGFGKQPPYVLDDAISGSANFIAPFVLDPNTPNRLLAGGASLWETRDADAPLTATTGPQWSRIKPPTGAGFVSAIEIHPLDSNQIWVGYTNGDIYRTEADGSWIRIDAAGVPLPNRFVTRIKVVDDDVIYATFAGFADGNLWKSIDGGTTWLDITGTGVSGLPLAPFRDVDVHPRNSDWLYVATEVGIFTSEDGGASWWLPHDGPANVSVDELFWMNDTLVAATHGRGLFTVTPVVATVATPTITPPGGTFAGPVTVTLETATPGATLRYTTDGTTPTETSTLYTGPFAVTASGTVQARGLAPGLQASAVASAMFTIGGSGGGASATFIGLDTTTQGTWRSAYGSDGWMIAEDTTSVPAYAEVMVGTPLTWTWEATTTEARALERANGGRVAATWYEAATWPLAIRLTDGQTHQVALSALDWDFGGRTQRVDVYDGVTGALLDTRTLTAFTGGQYLVWDVRGYVVIEITALAGPNGVVNGLFFGPAAALLGRVATPTITPPGGTFAGPVTVTLETATPGATLRYTTDGTTPTETSTLYTGPFAVTASGTVQARGLAPGLQASAVASATFAIGGGGASVTFIGLDTTTEGTWRSAYGSDGWMIAEDTTSVPAYAEVMVGTPLTWTWEATTTETRALERANGGRVAATWYEAATWPLAIRLTDGQTHQVALSALDWDFGGRTQRVDVYDGVTGALLDTRTLTAFTGGQYLVWDVRGHVVIEITALAGPNGVVNGLFFGGAPPSAPTRR